MSNNYIILTPVKNEQQFIRKVLLSVINQMVIPKLWVIVDGGSTDRTREIVQEFAITHPWIKLIHQEHFFSSDETTHMNVSYAVHEAYNYARKYCADNYIFYWYIWTTDGDQIFSPNVCNGIIDCMSNDMAGAASGKIRNHDGTFDEYPEGELPNKRVYLKPAIEHIGGFPVTKYSYDTVILAKLRMHLWKIKTYPDYTIYNLRKDSGIERDDWKSHTQFGRARYYLGYSFQLVVVGCLYLLSQKKILKAFGVLYGYLGSVINRDEIIADAEVYEHFRKDRLNEVMNNIWIEPKHVYAAAAVSGIFILLLLFWRFS